MSSSRTSLQAARARAMAVLLVSAIAAPGCGDDDESAQPTRPKDTQSAIDPADYSATVDHPLFPLASTQATVHAGREEDARVRVVSRVLDTTARIAGIEATVVAVTEYEDGELVERTRDYYAQDHQGNIWYLGEHVNDLENGKVVGHGGQWLAGRDGAQPGLFMPADPKVGDEFEQERAPGVAEDRSEVVAVGIRVRTPAGSFEECIKTKDFAPLDKLTEFKFYCSGVGLVREQPEDGRVDLLRRQ
jgi:hypothetical protein